MSCELQPLQLLHTHLVSAHPVSWLPRHPHLPEQTGSGRPHTTWHRTTIWVWFVLLWNLDAYKHSTTRQNTTASDDPRDVDRRKSCDSQRMRRAIFRIFFDSVCLKTNFPYPHQTRTNARSRFSSCHIWFDVVCLSSIKFIQIVLYQTPSVKMSYNFVLDVVCGRP